MTDHRHDYRRCVYCDDVLGDTVSSEERIEIIRSYAHQYRELRTFVETGTADGSTPRALLYEFDILWTIELDPNVQANNIARFADCGKIRPLCGESDKLLPELAAAGPALYWLDAHWCGGARGVKATPVLEEIAVILAAGHRNVILVDDVRLFGHEPEWPTLEEVTSPLIDAGYNVMVAKDVLRAVPK